MSSITACDSGDKAAPQTPCSTRNTTICSSDCAMPHSMEVRVKPISEPMKRFLRP